MKIAVLAANGRSGRAFVDEALRAGHTVRAGVRGTHHFSSHPRLRVVTCDATDPAAVYALVSGQDAVASFIGHVKGSPASVQTEAMTVLVAAMKRAGVRRVVSLTGTGVRFAGDRIPLIDYVLNMAIGFIDPARVRDGRTHADVLRSSGLDWTIIRVLKLMNMKPQPFELREHGPTKWFVGRAEVARGVLQVLEAGSCIRQAPIIGRARRIEA